MCLTSTSASLGSLLSHDKYLEILVNLREIILLLSNLNTYRFYTLFTKITMICSTLYLFIKRVAFNKKTNP